jgi:tetratricopeptide (TPR) repeat protein
VTDISFRKILGLNQQSYQRLKIALSLNLRRQIFIAVCDDLLLRDRLSAQLQAELAKVPLPQFEQASAVETQNFPRLVSLHLDLDDPNPIVQIAQWMAQTPAPRSGWQPGTMPAFQFLGTEKLTRQPAAMQRLFFTHLQSIEYNLPLLESSVVLWLTQPWFRALPQSAPEFWRCRTGVFEFIGDPTPVMVILPERIDVLPAAQPIASTPISSTPTASTTPTTTPLLADSPATDSPATDSSATDSLATGTEATTFQAPASVENLAPENPWEQFADDLDSAYLFEPSAEPLESDSVESELPESEADPEEAIGEIDTESLGTANLAAPVELQLEDGQNLSLIQQIEQLHQQQAPAEILAEAYCALGNLYRDRVEQGEGTSEDMAIAIQAYEQGLQYLPEQEPLWVDILNDVGNLYWMLSRTMSSTEEALPYLQRGLQAYQFALTKIDPQSQFQTYPMVQNNLGAAYADLARHQNPADSLRRSVEAYLQALRYRTPTTDPIRYASTQNNLGTTYWNLAQHQQPDENLKQAIVAYSEALRFYDPAQEPLNYAMIQNNLGTAYWNLAQYERSRDWLSLSLAAYRTALKYRTLEAVPAAFAASQNNLGTALWHMANHADNVETRLSYLQEAIAAYESALKAVDVAVRRPNTQLNFDQVATQNNLGLAHYQIATDTQARLSPEQQSLHLSAALRHHLLALQSWTQQPELRQTALNRVVETLRAFYNQLGLKGQNQALSMVPGQLLPEILPKL